MITAILYGILGGLVGVLVFLAAPIAADMAGDKWRYKVGQWYFEMSMKSYKRVLCSVTPHNDLELHAVEWDRDDQAEKLDVGDDPEKWTDPKGVSARCKNVPFNLALADKAKIIHPLDAVVGNALDRLQRQGRVMGEFVLPGQGQQEDEIVEAHSAHATIPDGGTYQALDVQMARKTLTESHRPDDIQKTRSDVEKSQEGFKQRDIVEMGVVMLACFGGALSAWVIYSNTGDTDSAVRLPVMLWGWLL